MWSFNLVPDHDGADDDEERKGSSRLSWEEDWEASEEDENVLRDMFAAAGAEPDGAE